METAFELPWLPDGHQLVVPGRGEIFYRHFRHADPAAPTVLLLHGWTASADLQFFTAYRALAERCSFLAIDHHGHGRGLRSPHAFQLEDAADDAAALIRATGVGPVIVVGYSMGGPIALHLAHRHGNLVRGLVLQATALEWRATLSERVRWRALRMVGPVLRSRAAAKVVRVLVRRMLGEGHPLRRYVPWIVAEMDRNDQLTVSQAGRALSSYDARSFAGLLGVPAEALVTTRDRVVQPRKQRELAAATRARVTELADDHFAAWTSAEAFARITAAQVDALGSLTAPDSALGPADSGSALFDGSASDDRAPLVEAR